MKDFERIRQRSYQLYDEELRKTGNDETALATTLSYIEEEFKQERYTRHNSFKKGMVAEVMYYHLFRKEQKLEPSPIRIDKFFKADFGGRDPATNKPILIDVTTNPYPKLKKARTGELKEVLSEFRFFESLGLKLQYRIAVFDPNSESYELSPLMLPIHNEGYVGHYIVELEPDYKDLGLVEMDAYLFVVYLDDPLNPSEAIDAEHIRSYMFFPGEVLELDTLIWELEELEYESKMNLEELVAEDRSSIAYFIRKEIGIIPSAVLDFNYIITGRNGEGYWDYIVTWIHPLREIKKTFGTLLKPALVDLSITD